MSEQLSEQHTERCTELGIGDLEPITPLEARVLKDLGGIFEAVCSTTDALEQTYSHQPDPGRVPGQTAVYEIVVRYPQSSLSLLHHVGRGDLGNATLLCYADVHIINPLRRNTVQSIEPDLSHICKRYFCSPEDLPSVREEVLRACEDDYKFFVTLPLLVNYILTETEFKADSKADSVRLKPPEFRSCSDSCSSVVSEAENYFQLRTSDGFEWAYDPTNDAKEVGVLIPEEMKAAAALELLRAITHTVMTDNRATITRRRGLFLVKE